MNNSEYMKDTAPAISVTVPLYNASKYLRQCLDSLRAQTLKSIEFILVNDGSTDDSGNICEEYAAKDSRFRVIHKENGGSASARQTGLDNSKGHYIIVCDSDDWVEPDMYERLYIKAEETGADIVCCGYISEYGDKSIKYQSSFAENNGKVINFEIINNGSSMSWNKLIKRSLFVRAQASYVSGINLSEDGLILYKLLKVNPIVVQINDLLYHYRRQFKESSYTNAIKMSSIKQLEFTYNWFSENYSESEYEEIVFRFANTIVFACLRSCDFDKYYLIDFLKTELSYKKLLSHRLSLKSLLSLSAKILPVQIPRTMVKMIYSFFYK